MEQTKQKDRLTLFHFCMADSRFTLEEGSSPSEFNLIETLDDGSGLEIYRIPINNQAVARRLAIILERIKSNG